MKTNYYRPTELTLKWLSIVFFFFSALSFAYYYKNGGTRDFGLYEKAGRAFANGENAYLTQGWRSGSFGSVSVWLILFPVPEVIKVYVIQTISFIGFCAFSRLFMKSRLNLYWIYSLILFLSPAREVINNLQITGFVLGLLSLFLAEFQYRSKLQSIAVPILQIIALAVAIDLKPHSLIFIVIFLLVKNYRRSQILAALVFNLMLHLVIDLINGNFLEIYWFRSLSNVGNASGVNGESTSIWKVIDYFTNSKIDTNIVSTIFVIGVFIICLGLLARLSRNQIVSYGFVLSSLLTYMHYYDLAPLAIIALIVCLENKNSVIGFSLVLFLFLPREILVPLNLLILVVLVFVLQFCRYSNHKLLSDDKSSTITFFKGIFVFALIHIANSSMGLSYRIGHAVMTSETMVMIFFYLYLNNLKILKIDSTKSL
jgi:hypothetical protein